MDVAVARRLARPAWLNVRTVLGLLLFAVAIMGGQRVLAGAEHTVEVWVAARDLAQDTRLSAADLEVADVRLTPDLLDRYATAADSLEGDWVMRPVGAGELISTRWTAPAATPGGSSMSIPVAPEHAVGGALHAGDRIDVYATYDPGDSRARTSAVVRDAAVLSVVTAGGLVVDEESLVGVTIRVDSAEAARIAFAIRTAEIDVVRLDGPPEPGSADPESDS